MIGDRTLSVLDLGVPLDRPLYGRDLVAVISKILQPIWTQAAGGAQPFSGLVTALNTGPPKTITVKLASGTITARYDIKITPVANTTVVYGFRTATQAIAVGALA